MPRYTVALMAMVLVCGMGCRPTVESGQVPQALAPREPEKQAAPDTAAGAVDRSHDSTKPAELDPYEMVTALVGPTAMPYGFTVIWSELVSGPHEPGDVAVAAALSLSLPERARMLELFGDPGRASVEPAPGLMAASGGKSSPALCHFAWYGQMGFGTMGEDPTSVIIAIGYDPWYDARVMVDGQVTTVQVAMDSHKTPSGKYRYEANYPGSTLALTADDGTVYAITAGDLGYAEDNWTQALGAKLRVRGIPDTEQPETVGTVKTEAVLRGAELVQVLREGKHD